MTSQRLFLLTCIALLWGVGSASAGAHKDTRLGFQFTIPRDFQAIALSATEKRTVAKYQSTEKSTSAKHTYRYDTLRVYFYPTKDTLTGEARENYIEQIARSLQASHGACEEIKESRMKVARRPAWERLLITESRTIDVYHLLIDAEDGVFVFSANAFKERFSKTVGSFRKAAKSFKRIPKDAALEDEAEVAQMSSGDLWVREQIERLPPGWESRREGNQLLLFNAEKRFVDAVGSNIASIRAAFEAAFALETPFDYVQVVRVCDSENTADTYSGGTFTTSRARNVAELATYPRQPEERSHMLLRYYAYYVFADFYEGVLSPHPWYAKGHADYFAGADMSRSGTIRKFADQPRPWAMGPTLAEALKLARKGEAGGITPLREFMAMGWDAYRRSNAVHEAQGWALIHMLREHRLPRDELRDLLPTYLDNMKAGRHAVAIETMASEVERYERLVKFRGDELDEDEEPPSDNPEDYYAQVDDKKVQAHAFEATFGHWTDADWNAFQSLFEAYAKRL